MSPKAGFEPGVRTILVEGVLLDRLDSEINDYNALQRFVLKDQKQEESSLQRSAWYRGFELKGGQYTAIHLLEAFPNWLSLRNRYCV